MSCPKNPKIYHIVHVDRLSSIITDNCLWCDSEIVRRSPPGTTIGMNGIKQRRLHELKLSSHNELYVGQCVPFYFCPRSIMLYVIYCGNLPELIYRGGQTPIIHLQADLYASINWAESNRRHWAFTLSNAGARYFKDYCDISHLNELDWDAIQANRWSGDTVPQSVKERKQAEFLVEYSFPWELIERIGVHSHAIRQKVADVLPQSGYRPQISILPDWYY